MIIDKHKCISDFLRYRTVLDGYAWEENIIPEKIYLKDEGTIPVKTSQDLDNTIKIIFNKINKDEKLGIMLSGGIDSAILASYMPEGSIAYTMKSIAENSVNEVERAKRYAKKCNLDLRVVEITWEDMNRISKILMKKSKMPHHSIQPMIYRICEEAHKDGIKTVLCGENADLKFGGFDGLLSKDWSLEDFIERYTFLCPDKILKNPVDDFSEFEKARTDCSIDVHKFLNDHYVKMALHDYILPFKLNNMNIVMPYAYTYLDAPLDLKRVRNGENKYIVRELYNKIYPDIEPEKKLPMPRAVGIWLKDYQLSSAHKDIFKDEDISEYKPDQKWQLYILEMFLDMLENGELTNRSNE
ncbi:MAG: asparagine synthase C-terminal domain-containing protein [Candidatus Gastranaerophilales bacterium]|nr:asparagine synthase C-terminal domain-containing protein [Candidatus Gastranaerophilales bacterium]